MKIPPFKFYLRIASVLMAYFMISCLYGNQKLHWSKSAPLDYNRAAQVVVDSTTPVNTMEMSYLKETIPQHINGVLKGDPNGENVYKIHVTITRYEEGSAMARFMLIGLGQMYLNANVEITEGDPPTIIRTGQLKKQVRLGGLLGYKAKMHDSITSKVGTAIAAALREAPYIGKK